jgi:hypothetical protein
MFRSKDRVLKAVRKHKSSNSERNKNVKCGTGLGLLAADISKLHMEAERHALSLGYAPDPNVRPMYWDERHPDQQINDVRLHDRTRWEKSKENDKLRKNQRMLKQSKFE